jgi:hypothetical protein
VSWPPIPELEELVAELEELVAAVELVVPLDDELVVLDVLWLLVEVEASAPPAPVVSSPQAAIIKKMAGNSPVVHFAIIFSASKLLSSSAPHQETLRPVATCSAP